MPEDNNRVFFQLKEVFGPTIKTFVFPEFNSRELLVIQFFFISTMHSISFANWYV